MKKSEEKLQALILLDELEISMVKSPLQSPLEVVLRRLETSNLIDEIFVFSNQEKEQLESFIKRRKGRKATRLLFSECGDSTGDKLREIHSMRVLVSDFVLVR